MSIAQLIQEIENGEIVLPAIQRDFVWKEEQVTTLLDSLFRGYPVGIVLLWETYQPIQFRTFVKDFIPGALHKFADNRKGKRVRMVLDGQQRLNSLYVALKGSYSDRYLYYDALSGRESDDHSEQKYRFRFATEAEIIEQRELASPEDSKETPQAFWISLSELLSLSPIKMARLRSTVMSELGLSDEDALRLEVNLNTAKGVLYDNSELFKTQTIDSNLPQDSADRKSAFDILEIFVRINRQGVQLKRSDLIVSMLRLYWNAASDLLPRFLAEINSGGNLHFDNDFVIRCMFSTAGLGTRLDFDLLRSRTNVEKIKTTYEQCFNAIRSVRDFVRHDCGIDNSRLLGGISTLVPFVHYLFHAPKHTFALSGKADAMRSIYLFAFSRLFSQHSESRTGGFIRDHLNDNEIKSGAAFPLADAISFTIWKTRIDQPDITLFGNNVDLALGLLQRKSGGQIALAANLPEVDHIFPQASLEAKGWTYQSINDLANFWILPQSVNRNKSDKHPKIFLEKVDSSDLDAAFIDRELLDFRKYARFIELRGERMIAELQTLTRLTQSYFEVAVDSHIGATEFGI